MAQFISQSNYSGAHGSRVRERIKYLLTDNYIRSKVDRLIREYFTQNPEGDKVTLYIFSNLKLTALQKRLNRDLNQLKKDIGLLIPIIGAEIYSPNRFFTYRNGTKNSTRSVPKDMQDKVPITRYTPHRIEDSVGFRSLFGVVKSNTDGVEFQNSMRDE